LNLENSLLLDNFFEVGHNFWNFYCFIQS